MLSALMITQLITNHFHFRSYRLSVYNYSIARYDLQIARYTMLKHKKAEPSPDR